MLLKKLKEKLKDDRARIQFGRIGNFGLLEMTRQRLRESSIKWNMVLSVDSFAQKILKKSEEQAFSNKAKTININIIIDKYSFKKSNIMFHQYVPQYTWFGDFHTKCIIKYIQILYL